MSAPVSPAEAIPASRRVLTIPNVLSVVRLCCIPLFLWLLFGREHRAAAAVLLGVLGATDWVDGYVARHFGQVSELGKMLDPTADRLLLIVGIGGITIDGAAPLWVSLVVLVREVVVGICTAIVFALVKRRPVDVTWAGKAGTFCLMFAFPLFLASRSTVSWDALARVLAWVFTVPGLVFSLWAAIGYLPGWRRALAERDGRPEAEMSETEKGGGR